MKRAVVVVLFSLCCRAACGQYPIYPAMPQAMVGPAYGAYQPGIYSGYGYGGYGGYGYGSYGYGAYGFGSMPYGGLNWLPPTLPSPYFVVPSGRQYLEQVRRREQTTYSQLKLLNSLQK
ncbi:MAG TPA: hypothetical protein VGI40_24200 [Pirellulaceae bacterium]|jgi:hypothetical protein